MDQAKQLASNATIKKEETVWYIKHNKPQSKLTQAKGAEETVTIIPAN